ncbi:MAG: hypothetical protein AAF740_12950 [Bacteroidota bacterium]
MNFFNDVWTGTVTLYLGNGQTIKLLDRNIKGQNKHESDPPIYERYAAYYLTDAECVQLKKSPLSSVTYRTISGFETGTNHLEVARNSDTLIEQLKAIGR